MLNTRRHSFKVGNGSFNMSEACFFETQNGSCQARTAIRVMAEMDMMVMLRSIWTVT